MGADVNVLNFRVKMTANCIIWNRVLATQENGKTMGKKTLEICPHFIVVSFSNEKVLFIVKKEQPLKECIYFIWEMGSGE